MPVPVAKVEEIKAQLRDLEVWVLIDQPGTELN